MKKLLLLVVLLALCWSCSSDKDSEEMVLCDAEYVWTFVVKNQSGKTLTITDESPYGTYPHAFTFARDKSGPVTEICLSGSCNPKDIMQDIFGAVADSRTGTRIGAGGFSGVSQNNVFGYPFTMTIDGEEVSDEIWLSSYWSFEPDPDNFYRAAYTLTVTDALLDSLPPVPGDE